jgi:hypothetical protein
VGRYYIAVGAVTAPTYYPDTASIGSAKPISIVAGSIIESVDFSRYTVAAASTSGVVRSLQLTLPPNSTGVLSGVIQNVDGSVAAGVTVSAVPISFLLNSAITVPVLVRATGTDVIYRQQGISLQPVVRGGLVAATDSQGRYRLDNVPPDTYNLIAGYSDLPVFYPGTSDSQKATAITTTPATQLTTLDFTLPSPPKAFSIRGSISANSGRLAGGFTLTLLKVNSGVASRLNSFLPLRNDKPITAGGDGAFEIPDVVPGQYSLQARISGASLTKTVEVTDSAVNIDFDFSINVLSGRIVWEDGSPISGSAIGPVAVSTTSNPNFVATTLMEVSNSGAFSSVIDSGDYRFYIRSLPAGYIVRTMTMGSVDLSKDLLHVIGDVPNTVEIRLAKGLYTGTRVHGRVMDVTTGASPAADLLELCCFTTGPFERLSTAILPDGSFDFLQVPPGSYTAELRKNSAQAVAGVLNRTIEIGDQESSGMLLVSATQLTSLTIAESFEDGSNLPSSAGIKVALLVSPGRSPGTNSPNGTAATDVTSIPMGRLRDGTFWAPFPMGVPYTLSIENIPEGYRIKSVSGPGPTNAVSVPAADGSGTYIGFAPGAVSIVLQRTPAK